MTDVDQGSTQQTRTRRAVLATAMGAAVFVWCIVGILTRSSGDLASFWPANAFMLGMLTRFPALASAWTWVACAAGYISADFITGADLTLNLILNGGNLLTIAVGYVILSRFDAADRRLARPASVLFLLGAIVVASSVAGLVGALADPALFGGTPGRGFAFWMATETVNFLAFLPMILSFPGLHRLFPSGSGLFRNGPSVVMPFLALMASFLAGVLVDGPGALAFPVPVLLWCALVYRLWTVACLSLLFAVWALLAIHSGHLSVAIDLNDKSTLMSIRFGIALLTLAPLVVASAMAARDELTEQLRVLARTDQLTGVPNRSAFFEEGARLVERLVAQQRPVTVMMLDIDHFKSINDRHGHATGDRVLVAFSDLLRSRLRQRDRFARIGGEEFAVVLPDCTIEEARLIGRRIVESFSGMRFLTEDGGEFNATVSIGVEPMTLDKPGLDALLAGADQALYSAKRSGRNRVCTRDSDSDSASS